MEAFNDRMLLGAEPNVIKLAGMGALKNRVLLGTERNSVGRHGCFQSSHPTRSRTLLSWQA